MPTNTLTAIILFAATYLGLLIFSSYRAFIALGSAALFVALGIMPLGEVFSAVDWNVIMMIAGTSFMKPGWPPAAGISTAARSPQANSKTMSVPNRSSMSRTSTISITKRRNRFQKKRGHE